MRAISITLIIVLLVGVAFIFFVYLGIYNVGASEPQTRWVHWILDTTMDNSVRRRAADIAAPPLDEIEFSRRGAAYFALSCALCHGAPGVPRSALAEGLNPSPPDLIRAARLWNPSELYWIIRNGIRMTGMPAFSHSYNESQMWDLVAFLRRLPALTPEEYQELIRVEGPPGD